MGTHCPKQGVTTCQCHHNVIIIKIQLLFLMVYNFQTANPHSLILRSVSTTAPGNGWEDELRSLAIIKGIKCMSLIKNVQGQSSDITSPPNAIFGIFLWTYYTAAVWCDPGTQAERPRDPFQSATVCSNCLYHLQDTRNLAPNNTA